MSITSKIAAMIATQDAGHYSQFDPRRGWVGNAKNQSGRRNPAGAKLIRGFYRAKFGRKASYKVSLAWYTALR